MVTTRRAAQKQDSFNSIDGSGPSTSAPQELPAASRGRGRSAARGRGRGRGRRLDPVEEDTPQVLDNQGGAQDSQAEANPSQQVEADGLAVKDDGPAGVHGAGAAEQLEAEQPANGSSLSSSESEGGDSEANLELGEAADGVLPTSEDAGEKESAELDADEPRREEDTSPDAGGDRDSASDEQSSDDEEQDAAAVERGQDDYQDQAGNEEDGDEEEDDDQEEDEEDDDDDEIFGSSMMQNLASSLKAALQARAGAREASPSPPPSGPGGEEASGKLGLSCDPNAISWQPEVKMPEVVAPRQRVAPGVGASKEKGLTKQLLAPPRSKEEEPPSKSEVSKRWFELPAPKITPELKQELRLLRLRGAYDPKRFYKSFDETKFPKNFAIGTVLDNPQDFYNGRLTSRERGASITQELLADPDIAAARKKRYSKLQQEAARYQKVKKRKTDLKRDKPKPKRPKH